MPNENDNKLVNLADLKTAFDDLDDRKKDIQTVVNDPTASGTAVSFIDSISQNAQGVISATKKIVQTASTTAAGLMSATDKVKLDGIVAGAGVTSVNNQTGAVSITPANIGAVATSGNQEIDGELRVNLRSRVKMENTPYHYGFVQFDDIEDGVPEAIALIGYGGYHDFEVREKKTNGGEEGYLFPAPTLDSGYVRHNVLTSKSPVTIPQGGTGATTPDGACANIGAVKKGSFTATLLYQGTPAVNATFTLSDYVGNYNILRIVDTHHYYCDVYMPVHTSTQAIMANGSTSYPYDGTPRFLLWEFTAISSDGINYTVARKAQANITSTGVEAIITNAEFGIEIYGLK